MKLNIKKGTTNKRIAVFIQDSTSFVGAGKTGLSLAGLTWSCWLEADGNADGHAVTIGAGTRGTWTSGATWNGTIVEKEAGGGTMPGWYELGIPGNALPTSGSNWVVMCLKSTGVIAPLAIEIQLVSYDPDDVIRMGLTSLPNAQAGSPTGIIQSDGGLGNLMPANSINAASIAANALTATKFSPNWGVADGLLKSGVNAGTTTIGALTVTGATTLSGAVQASSGVTANIVGSITGNISGSVGSVTAVSTGAITAASIANGAIDNATFAADVSDTAARAIPLACTAALHAAYLDRLVGLDVTSPAAPAVTSYLAMTMDQGASVFDRSTDSLQAIRDASIPAADLINLVYDESFTEARTVGSYGEVMQQFLRYRPVGTIGTPAGSVTSFTISAITVKGATVPDTSNDYWKGCYIRITTVGSALIGQVRLITAFDQVAKLITVSPAFTSIPTVGNAFDIVNI
jgi:hypothetical protein